MQHLPNGEVSQAEKAAAEPSDRQDQPVGHGMYEEPARDEGPAAAPHDVQSAPETPGQSKEEAGHQGLILLLKSHLQYLNIQVVL